MGSPLLGSHQWWTVTSWCFFCMVFITAANKKQTRQQAMHFAFAFIHLIFRNLSYNNLPWIVWDSVCWCVRECVCITLMFVLLQKWMLTLGIFIYLSLPYFLRQGFSLNLELTILGHGWEGNLHRSISLSSLPPTPTPGLQVCAILPDCYMSTRDLNSCSANILPTESFI